MKLRLLKFAALAALSLTLFMNSVQAETLRVGMECTYAPFNFKSPD